MAAEFKISLFWNVTPCSLVEIDRRFGSALAEASEEGRGPRRAVEPMMTMFRGA
jgi:hypothetical protein